MISKFICLSLLLLVVAQAKSSESNPEPKNLDDYAFGFLQAYGDTRFVSQIQLCLAEAEFAGALDEGMSLIQTQDPANVEAGIRRVGSWFTIFWRGFVLCQAGTPSVRNDILQLVQSFAKAEKVTYVANKSLEVDGVEVLAQVNFAVDAYNGGNKVGIGLGIGSAMEKIVHN